MRSPGLPFDNTSSNEKQVIAADGKIVLSRVQPNTSATDERVSPSFPELAQIRLSKEPI